MKTDALRNGLSARRKTIVQKFLFMAMLLLSLTACHDTSEGQSQKTDSSTTAVEGINKPSVNIKVNKRYDEKGQLIGFDSLYTSFYSSAERDTLNSDSLMNGFEVYFNKHHPAFFNRELNSLFFNDSLAYPDFFHEDFFAQHYKINDIYMESMMQQIDSIKNEFYRRKRSTKSSK